MSTDVGSLGRFLAPEWTSLYLHAAAPGFGAVALSLPKPRNRPLTAFPQQG